MNDPFQCRKALKSHLYRKQQGEGGHLILSQTGFETEDQLRAAAADEEARNTPRAEIDAQEQARADSDEATRRAEAEARTIESIMNLRIRKELAPKQLKVFRNTSWSCAPNSRPLARSRSTRLIPNDHEQRKTTQRPPEPPAPAFFSSSPVRGIGQPRQSQIIRGFRAECVLRG